MNIHYSKLLGRNRYKGVFVCILKMMSYLKMMVVVAFILPEGLSSSFCTLSSMKVLQSEKCKLWTLVS